MGRRVSVVVRGQLTERMAAAGARTASALDPGTRQLLTQVDIPNTQHRLLPGMFVYVAFKIGPSGTRWRVPATAVMFNAQGSRGVIVGPGNKLHFQDLVLGRDLGTPIDVPGGLQGDEIIVKQPTASLPAGQGRMPVVAPDQRAHTPVPHRRGPPEHWSARGREGGGQPARG